MSDQKLKCIIIDDDPLITDLIEHFCSKVPFIEYCIVCGNAIDGIQLINNQEFDLLFLDYNMPHLNGKGVLDMKQDRSKVIMITSHADFAVDSYNYEDVVDYLLKPISYDRFYKSLEKYQRSLQPKSAQPAKQSILVKDGTKWIPIQIKDIHYIKSDSNYVTIHTVDKKIVSLMNMKDLEKELPANFLRTHRSYIVNFDLIDYFSTDHLRINGLEIPISKKYSESIKSVIN